MLTCVKPRFRFPKIDPCGMRVDNQHLIPNIRY